MTYFMCPCVMYLHDIFHYILDCVNVFLFFHFPCTYMTLTPMQVNGFPALQVYSGNGEKDGVLLIYSNITLHFPGVSHPGRVLASPR